ncbi:MAG: holin [Brachymonas sp.]
MIQKAENADLVIAAAGSKTAYTGLFINIMGWLMTTEAMGLLGLLLTAVGVATNYYFRRRLDAREAASEARAAAEAQGKDRERELRMELMRKSGHIFYGPNTEPGEQDA